MVTTGWPEPVDEEIDDRRREATHRLICFQRGHDGGSWAEPSLFRSWCALFPLDAGAHTRAEQLLRLTNDRATLLDLDQRAVVHAQHHPDGHWEVRPIEGPGVLVGTPERGWRPGYAEAFGLLPLIVPRPGRVVSPYAVALGPRGWSISRSVETGNAPRGRSSRLLQRASSAAALARTTGAQRLRRSQRGVDPSPLPVAVPVDLDWRPADHGGSLAWLLIDDDRHGRLEAPIVGLQPTSIDAFPSPARLDGDIEPGRKVTARLADGTTVTTIRALTGAPVEHP